MGGHVSPRSGRRRHESRAGTRSLGLLLCKMLAALGPQSSQGRPEAGGTQGAIGRPCTNYVQQGRHPRQWQTGPMGRSSGVPTSCHPILY